MNPERFMDMMNMLPDDMLVSAYQDRFLQHTEEEPVTDPFSVSEQPVTENSAEISVSHPPRWITAAVLAASVLFTVGVGVLLLRGKQEEQMTLSAPDSTVIDVISSDTGSVPDFTLSEDGENIFGGHGLLRPVTAAEGEQYIIQDDEYYYYGGSRLLKSAVNGDDVSGLSEDFPQDRCDFQNLIGSGQDMYYVDLSTESMWTGHAGGLKRILADGTVEELHPQSRIAADDPNSINEKMYYRDILRLGETGIYYVNGYYLRSDDTEFNNVHPDPILLNSRTGETIALDLTGYFDRIYFNAYDAKYDEASGHLFMSLSSSESSIIEIDINTGKIVQEYPAWEHGASRRDWFVRDHVLHFLGDDPDNRYNVNWYTHDMDTGETKVLLADCQLAAFAYCDGKVYAVRHAKVGNDKLLSFAPDGSDEILLGEIRNTVYQILPISDPDNIVLMADPVLCILFRQDTGFTKLW